MAPSKKAPKAEAQAATAGDVEEGKVKVKKALLIKAVKAIVEVISKKSANANPLFGDSSDTMNLYFTLGQIPDKRKLKPVMIPLPHPMYDDKSEICFLCKDPQKKYKELLMQTHKIPGVTKVIGVDKLKRNYKTLDLKRKLADSFDLFLCDQAIMEMMPKILGSTFLQRKKKIPIPVRLREAAPEEAIRRALGGTPLRIPSGPCLTVKIGRIGMDEDSIVANAAAVIGHVVKHLQQQDNPIQSINVKSTDSPALPIWRRPRPAGFLDLKKYHSDSGSSAASDTGASAADTMPTSDSEIVSDAGETLSTRDSLGSDLETMSELDSLAGDDDEDAVAELPLARSLKKRKGGAGASPKVTPKTSPKQAPKESPKESPKTPAKATSAMEPPAAKKAKKAKKA